MFRWILITVVLCMLVLGVQLQRQINELSVTVQQVTIQQVDLPRLYGNVSPAVVWIGAEGEYGLKWQGSGFFVNVDGLIATAGHIVEDTESFEVVLQDGTKAKADFVYMEDLNRCDVGFIQIKNEHNKKYPYFRFDTEIEIGESVIILGHPWGLNNGIALMKGIVSLPNRYEPFFGTKLVIHTDAASYPGNSGSPIIDMDGECIGILIGGMYGTDNFSIVTSAKLVELIMQKVLIELELRKVK